MPTKIAIAGIMGNMGRTIANICARDARFQIVGGTESPNSAAIGKSINDALNILNANGEISSNISEACHNADIYIDFTIPKVTINALPEIAKTNVKGLIIGTTGFDDEQNQIFNDYTNRFAIVKTGNFSLGVNLLSILVEITAKTLSKDWDIEIVEAHHKRKIDAPSGTALLLGDAAALGRGENLNALKLALRDGITGPRPSGGIGFSAIRGGTIIGEHDVRFEGNSESVILTHKAQDRSIFANGAIEAAAWLKNKPNGLYDMKDVLGF